MRLIQESTDDARFHFHRRLVVADPIDFEEAIVASPERVDYHGIELPAILTEMLGKDLGVGSHAFHMLARLRTRDSASLVRVSTVTSRVAIASTVCCWSIFANSEARCWIAT